MCYIPPIRTDVEVPYDLKEYETFKREVKEMAESTSCIFWTWMALYPGSCGDSKPAPTQAENLNSIICTFRVADMRFSLTRSNHC